MIRLLTIFSSSSFSRFYRVTDEALKAEIRDTAHFLSFLTMFSGLLTLKGSKHFYSYYFAACKCVVL